MLTQEYLKSILYYDSETGLFTWKVKLSDKVNIGAVAGGLVKGYVAIRIGTVRYQAHKLAWLYEYNYYPIFPKENIDHKNGTTNDNRIENLRLSTTTQNAQNIKLESPNNKSTGLLGSTAYKHYFISQIRIGNGKRIHLGYFKTAQEAHESYLKAKRELHEFNTL